MHCYLNVLSPERKLSYRSSFNSCPQSKGIKQFCHLGEVSTAFYSGFGNNQSSVLGSLRQRGMTQLCRVQVWQGSLGVELVQTPLTAS